MRSVYKLSTGHWSYSLDKTLHDKFHNLCGLIKEGLR